MLCGTNFVCFQQYDTSKEYHYIKEYKDVGITDYILKPIDKDNLMNKISKYLK